MLRLEIPFVKIRYRRDSKGHVLALCYELWLWMRDEARQGRSRDKAEWPRWKKNGGDVPKIPLQCPCCWNAGFRWGIDSEAEEKACGKCLIEWPRSQFPPHDTCSGEMSPFELWCNAESPGEKADAADNMFALIEDAADIRGYVIVA